MCCSVPLPVAVLIVTPNVLEASAAFVQRLAGGIPRNYERNGGRRKKSKGKERRKRPSPSPKPQARVARTREAPVT